MPQTHRCTLMLGELIFLKRHRIAMQQTNQLAATQGFHPAKRCQHLLALAVPDALHSLHWVGTESGTYLSCSAGHAQQCLNGQHPRMLLQ